MNPRSLTGWRLFSRRDALGLGAAAVTAAALPLRLRSPAALAASSQDVIDALMPPIRPRSDWAGDDYPTTGELLPEDDVRFLLVHHTASINDYGPDDVVDQIRIFYNLHTGPEKGWPDVAYNFFVDRFGVIWEGRAGSIAGPVRGDATGGSQGFALLASLIGNHAEAPVTAEQQESLARLLAWLGQRYDVDTMPGATVSFNSRGSSRWPADTPVTARTISGHREMSTTTCPGDFAFSLLERAVPDRVTAIRAEAVAAVTATSTTASTTTSSTQPPASTEATPSSTVTTPSTANPSADGQAASAGQGAEGPAPTQGTDGGVSSRGLLLTGGALGVVAAVGAAITRLLPSGRSGPSQD